MIQFGKKKDIILYEATKNDKIWGIGFYDRDDVHKKIKANFKQIYWEKF